MPLSFADLAKTEVPLTVQTASGPVAIRYRPHAMTPQLEADIAKGSDNEDPASVLKRAFCALVSWIDIVGPLFNDNNDLVVAENAHIPVTPEIVGLLPSRLLIQIFQAVQEDMGGGPKPDSVSSGGSFTSD